MTRLIGLSLSFCIKDMIKGVVDSHDVSFITTGTLARTFADWDAVFKSYCEVYWVANPETACALAWDMIQENLILQPRLEGLCPIRFTTEPVTYKGRLLGTHWMPNNIPVFNAKEMQR